MSQDNWQNVLLTTYQEANVHLRTVDDKRDRLVDIYFSALVAAMTGVVLLRNTKEPVAVGAYGVAFGLGVLLIVVAEIVTWALVSFRKWHAEYMNCAILVQTMLRAGAAEPTADLVKPGRRHPFLPGFYTSRAFVLVQVGVVAMGLATGDLLAQLTGDALLDYCAGVVVGLSAVVANWLVSRAVLGRAEKAFWRDPRTSWCLAGL